jgi:hypothetical protein
MLIGFAGPPELLLPNEDGVVDGIIKNHMTAIIATRIIKASVKNRRNPCIPFFILEE